MIPDKIPDFLGTRIRLFGIPNLPDPNPTFYYPIYSIPDFLLPAPPLLHITKLYTMNIELYLISSRGFNLWNASNSKIDHPLGFFDGEQLDFHAINIENGFCSLPGFGPAMMSTKSMSFGFSFLFRFSFFVVLIIFRQFSLFCSIRTNCLSWRW